MKIFVTIFALCALVAFSRATPVKRDVSHLARHSDGPIFGNGIPGHEAEVTHYEFNKDDHGNYNFA